MSTASPSGALLLHAGGSMASALPDMAGHLRGCRHIVLVAYAVNDQRQATSRWRRALKTHRLEISGLHDAADARSAVRAADGIVVTGGNTHRLLRSLQERRLLEPISERVNAGAPYVGASAGANLAGPTIRTTNDMPIVETHGLRALGLVPFQINPHFVDAAAMPPHSGETRAERLAEFLEENHATVLALREGSWIRVSAEATSLHGTGGAVLFRRRAKPRELHAGQAGLRRLLARPARFDTAR